ncbi:MAG: Lrp/AsnC ligand binding domain-containing protein, partial [Candidatus Bathyarchaeia archaeon]
MFINLAGVVPNKGYIPRKDVLNELKNYEEIEEVIEVEAYNFDLILKARLQSLKRLSALMEELRCIEGSEELSSAIIIEETTLPPPVISGK